VLNTNTYAKIYLRKSSQRLDVSRSFQKLDQTLSYIGGLLGTVILFLVVISLYSQFCYEIEFGDRIFKQNQNGSYGSEDFNFIVYLGYGIFNVLAKFGIIVNWKAMKKYHKCRLECQKQLDIELLFRKLEFF
jgi:ABC-type multidrug transport system permease subunit